MDRHRRLVLAGFRGLKNGFPERTPVRHDPQDNGIPEGYE